jgi:hypothetical protein
LSVARIVMFRKQDTASRRGADEIVEEIVDHLRPWKSHKSVAARALSEVEMLLASAPGALAWFLFNPLPPMTLTEDGDLVQVTESIGGIGIQHPL